MIDRLRPGDMFVMRWTDEEPTLYLVIRERVDDDNYDELRKNQEDFLGKYEVITDGEVIEDFTMYKFDLLEDSIFEILSRASGSYI